MLSNHVIVSPERFALVSLLILFFLVALFSPGISFARIIAVELRSKLVSHWWEKALLYHL